MPDAAGAEKCRMEDLQATLERVRRPPQAPPMPGGPLGLRLRTSSALRQAVPSRVARALARRRALRIWEREPEERDRARAAMAAVVGGTPRAHEVEALARAHVVETETYKELFWQPWPTPRMDADSARRLEQALRGERGVLVSLSHLGPLFLHVRAVSARSTPYIVSAPYFFAAPEPGYWGRRLARMWKHVQQRDERMVCTGAGASEVLAELLRQREVVVIYFDMPGSRGTRFLGKEVMLGTGTARLATQTDALVLPIRSRLHGTRGWTDVAEPLDPRAMSGWEELHEAIAAVHERWILELPHTLEDPNRAGAWEGGATAQGWRRESTLAAR